MRPVGALDPKVGLEIGHQERGSDSLSGNITDDEAVAPSIQVQEVEIIAANLTSLNAGTRVLERPDGRQRLRKEPCLDLLGDFQFLSIAPLSFESLRLRAP